MDDAGGPNGTWRSWKRTRPWPVEAGSTPAVPTRCPAGSLVFPLAAGTPHSRSPTTENKFPQSQHNLFSDVFSSHTTRPTTGHAPLAQRSEQRSFKPWVVGSNPTGAPLRSDGSAGNRVGFPMRRTGCRLGEHINQNIRVERAINTIIPVGESRGNRNAMATGERMT